MTTPSTPRHDRFDARPRDVIIPDTSRERGGAGRPGLFLIPATERLVDRLAGRA